MKGYISKVVAYKRYFFVSSFGEEETVLFFEELRGKKLIVGDIIEYEVVETKEFGKCALNPEKVGNIYLEELKNNLNKDTTIEAYVYEKVLGGYMVSYNGYKCFLPNIENIYKAVQTTDDLLNTYQIFNVIDIEKGNVVLSRKYMLKEGFSKLRQTEIDNIKSGFAFLGKVKSVQGFGVFIINKYSEGLLHISNILCEPLQYLAMEDKKMVEAVLSKVFLKSREVFVKVYKINDNQFSVIWNKNLEPNKEICTELNSFGLLTE